MKGLLIIAKTFLKESDKNKLIMVLVGCLVASNWYWYEREEYIKQQEILKDAQYRERESVYISDNRRVNDLLDGSNKRVYDLMQMAVENEKKHTEDYKMLYEENKRLYDYVQKLLKE